MILRTWQPACWAGLWLLLTAVALWSRPVLPIGETRYLAVAWEMWRDGNYLVPHLNGLTYSHKPPLFFWLVNLGWAVFGVNDWWPRLVSPLFALANLFLIGSVARQVWPDRDDIARIAPLILIGGTFWALYTTLTMFDMMLACFTLVGILGIVRAWRGRLMGFAILGLGIGLGALTKGPAILLHLLPVALLAPVWGPTLTGAEGRPRPTGGWTGWYLGLLAALVLGVVLALLWAVPAGQAGGEAYRDAIFWGQSAGRLVKSFAHQRPVWWYLALLPAVLVPWIIWPRMWRAVRGWGWFGGDGGLRFGLCWFVPALAAFSLVSGKQPHYLLPVVPALALIAALLLAGKAEGEEQGQSKGRREQLIPGLLAALVGALLVVLPVVAGGVGLPPMLETLTPLWGVPPVIAGLAVAWTAPRGLQGRVATIAGLSTVLILSADLSVRTLLAQAYDLTPVAQRLGSWERQGLPLAYYGKYHGQFTFLGRLGKPLAIVGKVPGDTREWAGRNPGGKVVVNHRDKPAGSPAYLQPFRRQFIAVWDSAAFLADPRLVQ
jgi:4-amino-4-deoxy-L-arabinose transferase-like glycosyltransferase